jgi:hypothetical protein
MMTMRLEDLTNKYMKGLNKKIHYQLTCRGLTVLLIGLPTGRRDQICPGMQWRDHVLTLYAYFKKKSSLYLNLKNYIWNWKRLSSLNCEGECRLQILYNINAYRFCYSKPT